MRWWVSGAALLVLWGCDPFNTEFEDVEPAERYTASVQVAPNADPGQLRVMTYNVKFGGGRIDFFFDCYEDEAHMTRAEVLGNMEALAAYIRYVDPDVLLLQEIEVESKRSAYVNQVQYLLEHTDLNHGAYASAWKADFVASGGIGRINMGNAILSKYPFEEATRLALPLISEQAGYVQYFYLHRNILRTRIAVPGTDGVWVLNTHTAAFAHDGTKKRQIDIIAAEAERLDATGDRLVLGGDFNALPPGSAQVKDFPDSVCQDEQFKADDYSAETDWMTGLYEAFSPAIPLADYQADNAPFFSHTTDKNGFWNRKLDYLFTNGTFVPGSGITHQGLEGRYPTMPLSDHAPVSVRLELR